MKLGDSEKKHGQSFTIEVKPKSFSYDELYECLSADIDENYEFTEDELKEYLFKNYLYDIIDNKNDLTVKL